MAKTFYLLFMLSLAVIFLAAYLLNVADYLYVPFENRNFTSSFYSNLIHYANTSYPLLFSNIRWNHMPLKVYIDLESAAGLIRFSQEDVNDFRTAMINWEDETDGTISFIETGDEENADITIEWARRLDDVGSIKTVGEGGPVVVNTGLFNLTVAGKITLVPGDASCKNVNIGMHELGHVLGLDHTDDPEDVMYPFESCSVKISAVAIQTIKELYEVQPNPDLLFVNATATRSGAIVNLETVIKNQGILNSTNTSILLKVDDTEIEGIPLRPIPPGGSLIFRQAFRIYKKFDIMTLAIDPDGLIEELDKSNNQITLS